MIPIPLRVRSESDEGSLKVLPILKADVHMIGTNEQWHKAGEKIPLKTKNILEGEL